MRRAFYICLALGLALAGQSWGQGATKVKGARQATPSANPVSKDQPRNKGIGEEGVDPAPPVDPHQADHFGTGKTSIVVDFPHVADVDSVATSPDGQMALSGSRDGVFKLWDLSSGRLIRTLGKKGDRTLGSAVKFLPDNQTILTAAGGPLQIWDAKSGQLLRTIDKSYVDRAISLSADGKIALLENADIFDLSSGRKLGTLDDASLVKSRPVDPFNAGALSPNGKLVVTGGYAEGPNIDGGFVRLWDATSGRLLRTLSGHSGEVHSVAFSPDSTKAASTSEHGGIIELWDVASGTLLRTLTSGDDSAQVVFSPDGKILVTGGQSGLVKLWDVSTGRLMQTFDKPGGEYTSIAALAVTPDNRTIISNNGNFLQMWDIAAGKPTKRLPVYSHVCSALEYLGPMLLAGCAGNVSVAMLDPATGRLVRTLSGTTKWVTSLAISPDQTTLLAGTGDARPHLWDIQSGQTIASFEYHFDSGNQHASKDYFVGFTADGRYGLSANHDGPLRIWNVKSGHLSRIVSDDDSRYEAVAISPDGSTFAGESWKSSSLELWNVAKGELIKKISFSQGAPTPLAFSPDGKSLLVKTPHALPKDNNRLALLNLPSGSIEREIPIDPDWIATDNCVAVFSACASHSVTFSPNGQTIVLGSNDGVVRLIDTKSGKVSRRLVGHAGGITAAGLSPDGKRVVSASDDRTIKFWDSVTGELLASTVVFEDNEWITITPEGFFDASANGAKALNAVRGEEAHSIDQFYDLLHRPDLVAQKLAGDPQGLVKAAASKLNLDSVASSGNTPIVKIVTVSPVTVSDASISIDATAVDRGGGIGRIEWRNNGKTIELDTTSGAGPKTAGRSVALKKSVSLLTGDNVIEIKAYNGENEIESSVARITVRHTAQPQVQAARPRLFVLTVGVNDYWDSKLHLNFAVPDARSVADSFQQAKGSLYEEVNVTTLLNTDVTQSSVDRVFSDLKGKIKPQDVFVFFLSGHGKTEDGKFYYLPQDFKYNGDQSVIDGAISHEKLKAWFTEIPAQKQVLLFDACESGALIQQQIAMRGLEEKAALDLLVRGTGATVLTATTDDKPAAEGLHQHGVFTYAVLSGFANADANGDGYVDVQELANYVFNEVPNLTESAWGIRQVPQMNVVGSIYPLVARTKILQATADSPGTTIPTAPTHVVIAATKVRQGASASSNAVSDLSPGMQVRLMETSGGWVLVARDGKRLGYVEVKTIVTLQ